LSLTDQERHAIVAAPPPLRFVAFPRSYRIASIFCRSRHWFVLIAAKAMALPDPAALAWMMMVEIAASNIGLG
jgi:hypothetical protein